MSAITRVLALLVLTLGLSASAAQASPFLETDFQDQNALLGQPDQVPQNLQTLRLLGVQRLRIGLVWSRIAPGSGSRRMPKGFNGSDPAAYPAANWAPYDTIVRQAARYGMTVNFDVGGISAPYWATGRAPSPSLARTWYPSAAQFGAFVHAVGERYDGHYRPAGSASALPKVNFWSLWNEPNVGASGLAPQTVNGIEVAPRLYRGLADAAYTALQQTGHGRDTILVGELASTGHANPGYSLGMQPLRFLRALFCVDSSYRQLRGKAASRRGCPTTAAASRKFASQNPVLFRATGWSHHPYHVTSTAPPNVPSPRQYPDWVTMADLPKLERALDRIQQVYGSRKRYPIYLTEYGYNTNPPQAANAVSPSNQAAYLNQAEYIAWRDSRVRTMTQYTLVDAPAITNIFSSFAAGLIYSNGTHKPSFDAYRLPLWMPKTTAARGSGLEVWGCIRPAHFAIPDTGVPALAQIQLQPGSSGPWIPAGTVSARSGGNCYYDIHVKFPQSGMVRIAYTYPLTDPTLLTGATVYSRSIRITTLH